MHAAERRLERERVTASLTRLVVSVPEGADPLEVMARALSVAAGDLEAMRVIVSEVTPDDASNPTVRLYAEALDRAGRRAKVAADTNLTGARLTSTCMSGANLTGANAAGADFSYALMGGPIPASRQVGGDYNSACASVSVTAGANLTNADLTGANLGGALVVGVTWTGATCPNGTVTNTGC